MTVNGSNFVPGDIARWNGLNRPTTYVNPSQLKADIPASDIALISGSIVTVFLASSGGGISNQLNFTIGPAPVVRSEGAVSAANPSGGSVLAQRGIATLYGLNLAAETAVANLAPPLPSTLDNTTLTIGGNSVPLFFISPGQINFQVPFLSVSRPTQVALTITHDYLSTTITVTLAPAVPSLFTTNSQGTGQGSILIAGTTALAAPGGTFPGARPAKKGEFLSIYGTGLGDVTNRPALGAASPGSPLANTLITPTATIGGVDSKVLFSGLAPGFVGLYQVNVQVPAAAPSGDKVPVVLIVAGLTSNTATVAVE